MTHWTTCISIQIEHYEISCVYLTCIEHLDAQGKLRTDKDQQSNLPSQDRRDMNWVRKLHLSREWLKR